MQPVHRRDVNRRSREVDALIVECCVLQRAVTRHRDFADDRGLAPVGVQVDAGDLRIRTAVDRQHVGRLPCRWRGCGNDRRRGRAKVSRTLVQVGRAGGACRRSAQGVTCGPVAVPQAPTVVRALPGLVRRLEIEDSDGTARRSLPGEQPVGRVSVQQVGVPLCIDRVGRRGFDGRGRVCLHGLPAGFANHDGQRLADTDPRAGLVQVLIGGNRVETGLGVRQCRIHHRLGPRRARRDRRLSPVPLARVADRVHVNGHEVEQRQDGVRPGAVPVPAHIGQARIEGVVVVGRDRLGHAAAHRRDIAFQAIHGHIAGEERGLVADADRGDVVVGIGQPDGRGDLGVIDGVHAGVAHAFQVDALMELHLRIVVAREPEDLLGNGVAPEQSQQVVARGTQQG